jgi:hypothetical protein
MANKYNKKELFKPGILEIISDLNNFSEDGHLEHEHETTR